MNKVGFIFGVLGSFFMLSASVMAQEVRITSETMVVEYTFNGINYSIQREQNPEARVSDFYSKTSRACPPFCVQPNTVSEGVETVGELELLDFLTDYVSTGKGYLIDSRTSDFYQNGTIPGAANLPHSLFIPSDGNAFFDAIMTMLHGEDDGFGNWSFSSPPDLLLFCNGPWCAQSPSAIRNLLAINYPAEKLRYYRGGMQNWENMGFSVELP